MLPLPDPRVDASWGRPDRLRVSSQDSETVLFLPFLESEARESDKHNRASAKIRIDIAGTGNFIFARSRRTPNVQSEEHRRRAAEM